MLVYSSLSSVLCPHVIDHLSKPMERIPRTGTVNSGCWVMGSHCKYINCNKCNALVADVDGGGGAGCAGAAGV